MAVAAAAVAAEAEAEVEAGAEAAVVAAGSAVAAAAEAAGCAGACSAVTEDSPRAKEEGRYSAEPGASSKKGCVRRAPAAARRAW